MRKRKVTRASNVSNFRATPQVGNSNTGTGSGIFTFPNGDRYEGEYFIDGKSSILFRQGEGIYFTDNFDRYECTWERDRIRDKIHISFNNGMGFHGFLNKDDKFSGWGSYTLSDGSIISAVWKDNKPFENISYKEPQGFIWNGEVSESGEEIRFFPANHCWDDVNHSEMRRSSAQVVESKKSETGV